MKKIALKLVVCMVALLCAATVTSCSKKDKKALLETVPAETAGLLMVDGQYICDQLELQKDGDDVSYGKELKQIIDAAGLSKDELKVVKQALLLASMTEKSVVVFEYEKAPWISFFVNDGDEFIKALEDVDEFKLSFDEEDGYKVSDQVAVKDDQVWIYPMDDIDVKTVDKFRDLSDKKQFTSVYEKITESFLADNVMSAFFVDINAVKSYLGGYEAQQVGMVQSIAFDDASFIVGTGTMNDEGASSEIRILNSKFTPAKFNFPLAKIDANGFAHVNADAPFIAALGINQDTVKKIIGLCEKYGMLSNSDKMATSILEQLSGTAAFSLGGLKDMALSVNFANEEAAKSAGQMFVNFFGGSDVTMSYAGNALIARLDGTPKGSGTAPKELIGQYFGIAIDYSKLPEELVGSLKTSKLGNVFAAIGPDGDGIKLTGSWKVKNPVKTWISFILEAINNLDQINLEALPMGFAGSHAEVYEDTAYYPEYDMAMDTMPMAVDEYYDYSVPAEAPAEEVYAY